MNVIKAAFGGSAFTKTQKVFQWDGEDKLVFVGVDLPETYQVHFSNSLSGESKTVLGTPDGVMIPPEYFVPGSEIYAWIWLNGDVSGYTKYQVTIPVYRRAQPTDITPTPAQKSALDQAIDALNEATEAIPAQINTALAEAKASGEFDGEDGVGVPTGGTTGQVLAKKTGADYDTEWVDQSDDGGVVYFPFTISGDTATPGTGVTAAAIYQAYDAGCIVCAKMSIAGSSNSTILPLRNAKYEDTYNRYTITFSGTTSSEFHTIDCVDEDGDAIWSYEREVSYNKKMGGIPKNDLAYAVQTSLGKADSAYQKPALGIPATDFAIGVQISLARADAAYQKPQSGIPATDLAAGVIPTVPTKTSDLNNDSGFLTSETDPTVPSWAKESSKPSYTASEVGAIAAPASPTSGDVLTYDGSAWGASAPSRQIPSGGNAGECLAKTSSSDYDLRWRTINDWTPAGLMRTAGGTAAKVAEWSFWSATQYPAWLVVTVGNSNTYAGAITLKVNGSTAFPIYINGAASSATNYSLPAGSYFVYFDGSKFDFRTDGKIPGDITGHADQDIAAPASPSTGDFLCWNGSAWVATTLAAWQGGNY